MTSLDPNPTPWAASLREALDHSPARILGAKGSALAKCLAEARRHLRRPLLIVAPDPEIAGDIHNDLKLYLDDDLPSPLFWPAWDILPFETDHPDVEVAADQVNVLRACLDATRDGGKTADKLWIVAPITALLQPTLSPKIISAGGLNATAGTEVSPEALIAHLVEGGLEPVAMVDAPGQFSRRGGILDIYPLLGNVPYRIEFFGDEIDTIRAFDPATQQSGPALNGQITLVDVSREAFKHIDGSHYGLLDFLPKNCAGVIYHPERITRVSGLYTGGFSGGPLFSFEETAEKLSRLPLALVPDLDTDGWPEPPWKQAENPFSVDLGATGWERLSGGFETAVNELSILVNKNVALTLVCNNEGEETRLRKMLADKRPILLERATLRIGRLSRGFVRETASGGSAFVSDHEVFSRNAPVRVARKRFAGTPIADFAELREGDYVVHVANGIARFEGIQTLEQNGSTQDFLTLRFAEDARIYVPLSHIDLVQRYIGLGEAKPQLSKLGSAAWSRRKEAVEKAVRDIAQDLLATQAKRLSSQGIALPQDDNMVEEFDLSFPYDETPDQLTALEDIRRDQQSTAPMERLLCGDVGFGKTEMAVRAAFRAANAGYQAAVLVPTTILAEQHYRTFSQRMADYPVRVECLSRFRGQTEQKRIVELLADGKVDVIVGTHRILSEDIHFKNLGLVVIDEEQKFGVEAKERLKRFRADVDILTMTATPIPRTLHMSLLGLRDISNLTTAPRERHSVKTMVVRWSKEVIRRAILRELARGGQCFFLHNRVHNIDEIAGELQHLVPEARFGVGHGQMAEGELLEVMQNFLDGKLDVLVCTTIIESGVDIPSVNTLFVNQADYFGLSELHQLRGRVGRYKHQAYAYFLVPEKRPISPEATKRLQALQEYTELGSGFRIAMRDLEIRGAGNLLGVEQSGHIHMIGFDLYCRLLERAVAAQKGEEVKEDYEAELDLGTRSFIPPEYIPSEQQRIEFYRRLTRIRSLEELAETRAYVRDRYGPPPAPVERCFEDQRLRVRMVEMGVESIGRIDGALAIGFGEGKARRAVMLFRHAGLRATPLRKNQWRVEVPGVEMSPEAGAEAAAMADKALAVLEAGASRKGGGGEGEARASGESGRLSARREAKKSRKEAEGARSTAASFDGKAVAEPGVKRGHQTVKAGGESKGNYDKTYDNDNPDLQDIEADIIHDINNDIDIDYDFNYDNNIPNDYDNDYRNDNDINNDTDNANSFDNNQDNLDSPAAPPSPPLEFFSSDMLDEAEEADTLPPPRPKPPPLMPPPKSEPVTEPERETDSADPAAGPLKKRKKGKSGTLAAPTLKARLLAQREETVAGGARLVAKMPGAPTRPGIISIGAAKPEAEKLQPFKKKAVKSLLEISEENAGDSEVGAKVFGIEPNIADAKVGVVVMASAFNPIRSDRMTLVLATGDGERRFVLPCVGLAMGARVRAVLWLGVRSSDEARLVSDLFLAADGGRLFDGEA